DEAEYRLALLDECTEQRGDVVELVLWHKSDTLRVQNVNTGIDVVTLRGLFFKRFDAVAARMNHAERYVDIIGTYRHRADALVRAMKVEHFSEVDLCQNIAVHHDDRCIR